MTIYFNSNYFPGVDLKLLMKKKATQRNQEDFRIAYQGIVNYLEAKFGVYTLLYYKSS
jgi:hypothetical protein